MASAYKTLGQVKPSAATLTTLYTVPSSTSTVVSTIVACNQSAVATAFRISIRKAGAADDPKQYLVYDVPIAGNDSFVFTIGVTLATTDVISVYCTLATVSFSAFGQEIV